MRERTSARAGRTRPLPYALPYAMTTITATAARKTLHKLLADVSDSHEPMQIVGKQGSAVLVAAEDWRAIQETLDLRSIRGMRKSLRSGMRAPVSKCVETLRR
jgi:antitoxin YefM